MNSFESTLKKYLDIFADQEMYFVNDTRTLEIFSANPLNTDTEIVRMKIGSINDIDLKHHSNPENMVVHILKLSIDERLKSGDLAVVEDMAAMEGEGKKTKLLHFASAYCTFHQPEVFPIYSDQHLEFYKSYILNFKLPLDPSKVNTYPVFCSALKDLVQRLGLTGKMNYLQIRKFGWLYAEKVQNESKAAKA